MQSYQAVKQGPSPSHAIIKQSQATLLQAVNKIGTSCFLGHFVSDFLGFGRLLLYQVGFIDVAYPLPRW